METSRGASAEIRRRHPETLMCGKNEKYRVVDIVNKHGGIANKRSNTGQTDFEMRKFMTSQNIQDQWFQVVLMWKLLLQRISEVASILAQVNIHVLHP
jgi:hypothetical protein